MTNNTPADTSNNKSQNKSKSKLDKLAAFEQKILGVKSSRKTEITETREKSVKNNKNKCKPKKTFKKIDKSEKSEKFEKSKKSENSNKKIQENSTVKPEKKLKPKKKKSPRKLTFTVCNSKKSCGEHYGPYIWQRLCNENDQNPESEEFEKNGITYKNSHVCQGRCKKASNVRVEEPKKGKTTQFSYMTPLKAVKLAKSLHSGAAPENIKKL